jgi:hypothetical protein
VETPQGMPQLTSLIHTPIHATSLVTTPLATGSIGQEASTPQAAQELLLSPSALRSTKHRRQHLDHLLLIKETPTRRTGRLYDLLRNAQCE